MRNKILTLLELNLCTQRCDCGWNIKIGGQDKVVLNTIIRLLEKNGFVDLRNKKYQHSKRKK